MENDIYDDALENILKEYSSLRKFVTSNNISETVFKIFNRKKIISNSQFRNYKKLFKYFNLEIPSTIEFKFFDGHVESYGSLEELKKFKEMYEIPNTILFEKYKESWHLAFHGFIAEYIRLKKS